MPVSEYELSAILDHCRRLIDAADQFDDAAGSRRNKAVTATEKWEGPFRVDFGQRFEYEAIDLAAKARSFRSEADEWANIWAETVNEINEQRRKEAVDQIKSQRSFGESFVDIFVGDDSGDQVRAYQPVTVPTEASRYAATGGLESF